LELDAEQGQLLHDISQHSSATTQMPFSLACCPPDRFSTT